MNDDELLRYGRHIMLPQFGIEGQERLASAHVLIIGLGGLGSPAAMYLAASGVGRLTLVDDDIVELSNLQRQIVHHSDHLGKAKVASAKLTLTALNPHVQIDCLARRLDSPDLQQLIGQVDIVLDCTDNFASRFAINAACFSTGVPLVSGAAIGMQGQLSVFIPGKADSPCYRCLYDESGSDEALSCSENGVLSPVVGTIGTLQALEAIKVLTGIGDSLCGRLLVFDALYMDWRTLKLKPDPLCPVCGQKSSQ
jgi:adenylyltransferase/sulfurtransferase